MRTGDIVSGAILFVIGVAMIVAVIPNHVETGGSTAGDLPASFMPYVSAAILSLVAALHVALRVMGSKQADQADDEPSPFVPETALYIVFVIAIFVGGFFALSVFGYLYGAPIVVAGFMAMTRTSWKAIVATSLGLPIALWLLMEKLLGFPLP